MGNELEVVEITVTKTTTFAIAGSSMLEAQAAVKHKLKEMEDAGLIEWKTDIKAELKTVEVL